VLSKSARVNSRSLEGSEGQPLELLQDDQRKDPSPLSGIRIIICSRVVRWDVSTKSGADRVVLAVAPVTGVAPRGALPPPPERPARGSNCMNAAIMLPELHERGIHAVSCGGWRAGAR
jgi:hypothetical protein